MTIRYTKNRCPNFTKKNIDNALKSMNNIVSHIAMSPTDHVLVNGTLHRSQWSYDNPYGYYWLKIKCYSGNTPIHGLSSIHLYMGFVPYGSPYVTIPSNIHGTDLPNVQYESGEWVVTGISYRI
jgi:hypothetical protein